MDRKALEPGPHGEDILQHKQASNMIKREHHRISYLQFSHLSMVANVRHGVFTRKGGYSSSPYHSLNVSLGVGDEADRVERNRQRVSQCMQAQRIVFMNQVHGDRVLVMDEGALSRQPTNGFTGDAMVTHIRDLFLGVQAADCQAVLLFDPVKQIVANVHSGWRGSIQNILGKTVEVMGSYYGSRPGDIIGAIGPSLGPCCGEFVNYRTEIPAHYWRYRIGSNHFDFWSISMDQLNGAGVKTENIYNSRLCTKCNTDDFFSYRGEGITGRFAVVVGLCG